MVTIKNVLENGTIWPDQIAVACYLITEGIACEINPQKNEKRFPELIINRTKITAGAKSRFWTNEVIGALTADQQNKKSNYPDFFRAISNDYYRNPQEAVSQSTFFRAIKKHEAFLE